MPIFSKLSIFKSVKAWQNLLAATLVVAGTASAHAFDPSKVFKGEMSSEKVFKFYFAAREKGQQDEAFSVLKYAAQHGNSAAQWKLGRMYQMGDGVAKNSAEAFNIFKGIVGRYGLSNPNSPEGQFAASAMVAVGQYYSNGIPGGLLVPNHYQARVMFTTSAMVFRNTNAQFELGRLNLNGNDGMRDPKLAAHLFQLSIRKGHNGAKAMYGHMLFEGEYITPDPVQGLVLLSQARELSSLADADWIAELHEDAFALATPEQRKKAIAELAKQQQSN